MGWLNFAAMLRGRRYMWSGSHESESDAELTARYGAIRQAGFDGVMFGGPPGREMDAIVEFGLELHAWMWTTNRRDLLEAHPGWAQVSRSGKSCATDPPYVDYYRWVSPFCAAAREAICDIAADLARDPRVAGVHLDYVRFPDVILPRALWRTYGLDQSEELDDYDFDYSEWAVQAFFDSSGLDPRTLQSPSAFGPWLRFRAQAITRLVTEIRASVSEKALTAAVFPTPRLARMICRQEWDRWPLDAVFPMLYHSFYDENLDWVEEGVKEGVRACDFPLYAGLYLPAFESGEEVRDAISRAERRGAAGVSLFGEGPSFEQFAV